MLARMRHEQPHNFRSPFDKLSANVERERLYKSVRPEPVEGQEINVSVRGELVEL